MCARYGYGNCWRVPGYIFGLSLDPSQRQRQSSIQFYLAAFAYEYSVVIKLEPSSASVTFKGQKKERAEFLLKEQLANGN